MLYGINDGQPWYLMLPLREDIRPGCFLIEDKGRDEGDRILFDNGLRLPKAADFEAGYNDKGRTGGGPAGRARFCTNASGEVVTYGAVLDQAASDGDP